MNHHIKVGISLCLILCIRQLSAQSDTTINLSDILISDSRIDLPFNDVSRSIEVIDATDIAATKAQSINELLQTVTGVDIRQRGVNGVQADLSIRGGTFEQALVLINGVKMLDPQTGHHMMNLPITLADIDRVEILKGPGARVFGQNAFAGAINIITKTSTERKTTVGVEFGENGLLNLFGTADLPVGNYQQKVSVSRDHSDGYRDNTDYEITNLFYQGHLPMGTADLNLMAGHTARDFGANGFYGNESFVDQYEETRTTFVSAGSTVRSGNLKIAPRLSWRRNKDNWQFRRQDPEFFQNFHTSDVITAEVQSGLTHDLGILGVGIEYNDLSLTSNNLGERDRTQLGLHLDNRFLLLDERLDITPGVYFLKVADYDWQVFPGLDLGYVINNDWKLFVNYGRTSRIPSYTDLYYEDRGNVGNPNLAIESASTFELGAKYHTSSTVGTLSFFRRNSSNLIDWFRETEEDRWMPDNFGSASYTGIDASWQLSLSDSFLQFVKLGYLYLDASLTDNDFAFSRNALENLKHQLIIQPSFQIMDHLTLNAIVKYNDRVSLDDYMLVSANASYELAPATITLRVHNVFDTDYRETNLVPMPGRWISAGVRATF